MLSWIYDCLVSLVTRSSQGQRILLNLDLLDLIVSLFKDIEPVSYKVHDPRVLSEFQSHCNSKLKSEILSELRDGSRDYERLADLVMVELQIDAKYRHLVLDAVTQMCRFYSHLKAFDQTCLTKVSEEIKEHRKLFESVWKTLENRSPPKSYKICKTDDRDTWGYLGFQMPLSDFRRTGLLGLLSLERMASDYPRLSRSALALSRDQEGWFPFALTSINVSSWVLDFYGEGLLSAISYNNESDPLEIFFLLHSYVFFHFVDFYIKNRPNSVLDFNKVATEYKLQLGAKFKRLIEDRYDKDKVDSLYGSSLARHLKAELDSLVIN